MAVSVFFGVGALGLLIGPGIAGGVTVLGSTLAFGGNFGGAKLILVAKETGGLVVVDVLDISPLVSLALPLVSLAVPLDSLVVPFVSLLLSFEVSFAVALFNGFLAGTEVGRLKGLGEPLVEDCLLTNDVRGVVLVFVVEGDFVAVAVFEVGVLGDDTGVVFVNDALGAGDVVLAEVGRDETTVVLTAGFGAAFVVDIALGLEIVFGTVVDRTLEVGLEDGAVVGLDKGFDAVDNVVVFLILDIGFDANGFVVEDFVEVVLALETFVSTFFGADFFEAIATPVAAAIAAVPAAATTAIPET